MIMEQRETRIENQTMEDVSGKSIPDLFLKRVGSSSGEVAFRHKDLGIYKDVTWAEYWRHVEDFAFGLMDLGLGPGDSVAIMADPCPEWMYADFATLSAGGMGYGIYTTSSVEEVEYLMKTGRARFFVAENQEYVDKLLPVIERLPRLFKLIVIDTRATFMYDDDRLISFDEVEELGRERKEKFPGELYQRIGKINPDERAFLIFTSGTSGPPKPAALSHTNILNGFVLACGEVFPTLHTREHRGVSHLSMAHIIERGLSLYCPLFFPYVPHIGESLQYMQETLYEVQPTFLHGVPRIWEKIAAQALVGIESSIWIKRLSYKWAMSLGRRYMEIKWKGVRIPLSLRLGHWAAVQMAFRHILHRLGLSKTTYAFSAGAPIPTETQMLWQIWGVDLINLYGATEAGGFITSQRPGFPEPGGMGKPTTVNKVTLAEDGEVQVSGKGVFLEYFKNEEATAEAKEGEAWLAGDVGEWMADGTLKLIDRKKDIMITSGGKNITPSAIETAIKASPYISEAVLIADGRKFPSALIEIDFETVSDWARREKILYTGFTGLANDPKTYELIGKEVEKANQSFARVEQVKKFRILPKELDPEEGDTTATRKIKRKTMYRLFENLIEEMYSGKGEVLLHSQVERK